MSNWIHTINPFAVATRTSKRKMLILISDHSSRLQAGVANPVINSLYNRTAPVKLAFSIKYSAWELANGLWKAETARINAGLKDLSSNKIEDWDIRIQGVFRQGSPDYISLLPNRRIPFQEGTMDDRIAAVNTLGNALGLYPAQPVLVTLKAEVDAYYTDLLDKRNVQQQKEGVTKTASDELEAARMDCAVIMFQNLGILIDTYPTQPELITNYYQMDLLQDTSDNSEEYTGTLAPSEFKNAVPAGKVTQQSNLYIKNTGSSAIMIGLSDTPHGFSSLTEILQPGDDVTITDELPELTAYYINVQNQSGSTEGAYQIIIS